MAGIDALEARTHPSRRSAVIPPPRHPRPGTPSEGPSAAPEPPADSNNQPADVPPVTSRPEKAPRRPWATASKAPSGVEIPAGQEPDRVIPASLLPSLVGARSTSIGPRIPEPLDNLLDRTVAGVHESAGVKTTKAELIKLALIGLAQRDNQALASRIVRMRSELATGVVDALEQRGAKELTAE